MENKENIDYIDNNTKQGILHIIIEKDLLKLFKITCIQRNKSMKEGITQALHNFINKKE